MRYLNLKTNYGVETVDQIDPKNFENRKSFRMELKRLVNEYHLCGMNVYLSQRCDKSWKQ